jgi:GMP synthase (glutamine-hydrolysing)
VKQVALLVVEGNDQATSTLMQSLGGKTYGVSYAALLESFDSRIVCTIVSPSEKGAHCLPEGKSFIDYQGIVWTGSALNCYNTAPEVSHQIEMAKQAYASGVSIFGSCWGMQIMTIALGGSVRCNPKGREIGVGRDITLTDAGNNHPMFKGKGDVFDTLEVHMDEVDSLPQNAIVLAGNAMSKVQAMSIDTDRSSFWGVQYHPEFNFATMAIVMRRLHEKLLAEKIFKSAVTLDKQIEAYSNCETDSTTNDSVNNPVQRHLEITNWLHEKVLTA